MDTQNKQKTDDEIDVVAIVLTLWKYRKRILRTSLVFMFIGLCIAIFSEKEYTSRTTFMSQTSDSKIGGSIGSLASFAGFNLGGMSNENGISPTLYPKIINSISYQKELMLTPLTIQGVEGKITFREYYLDKKNKGFLSTFKKYTIGLPSIILSLIKESFFEKTEEIYKNQLITISKEEYILIQIIKKQLILDVNEDGMYINLSAKMPEAIASAELAFKAKELLQKYIINFKIQKSKEQLKFIKERYSEVENKYKKAQSKLAKYRDRNQGMMTALSKMKLEVLQDEYNIVYTVYSEMAKNLESQYIKVTEDTPVFTVLDPVSIPFEKSKPLRLLIIIIWTFLGVLFSLASIFGGILYEKLNKNWKYSLENQ